MTKRRKLLSVPADWQDRLERQKQWRQYQRWRGWRARERSIREFEEFCLQQVIRVQIRLMEWNAMQLGPQIEHRARELDTGQLTFQKRGHG